MMWKWLNCYLWSILLMEKSTMFRFICGNFWDSYSTGLLVCQTLRAVFQALNLVYSHSFEGIMESKCLENIHQFSEWHFTKVVAASCPQNNWEIPFPSLSQCLSFIPLINIFIIILYRKSVSSWRRETGRAVPNFSSIWLWRKTLRPEGWCGNPLWKCTTAYGNWAQYCEKYRNLVW